MPSAADLDAVAEERRVAKLTEHSDSLFDVQKECQKAREERDASEFGEFGICGKSVHEKANQRHEQAKVDDHITLDGRIPVLDACFFCFGPVVGSRVIPFSGERRLVKVCQKHLEMRYGVSV